MEQRISIDSVGPPEVMRLVAAELPQPGPAEVLVRNAAITVNFIDVHQRAGRYPIGLPSGLGMEAAGYVEAVGEGVERVKPGDPVLYITREPGSYSSVRICPAASVVPLPPGIELDQAAAIFSRGLLAWHLTKSVHSIGADDHVLIYAAAGGVGSLIAQFAAAAGANVIGVVGSSEKQEAARRARCQSVLLADTANFSAQVRELTGGAGATVVYDSIGQATFRQSLDSLGPHGLMIAFGNASGKIPPFSPMEELGARGSLRLAWPMLKDFLSPRHMGKAVPGLFGAVKAGQVSIEIGQRFSLADAPLAHRAIEQRRSIGATILEP